MFEIFEKNGHSLYLVGGTVRDRLLGVPSGDLDYATDATVPEIVDLLAEHGIKAIPTGLRFGTVTAVQPETDETVQITTFRSSEVYHRGSRFPDVEFGKSILEDLNRRDFRMNAMAIDSSGELIDPFGGEKDIAMGVIDTPGSPDSSFLDDPLRILRAYRFAAKLGFEIAQRVRRSAKSLSDGLSFVSAERKYKEMNGLVSAPDGKNVADTLELMKADGVLQKLIPELSSLFSIDGTSQGRYHSTDAWHHTLEVVAGVPPVPVLRWAALLHDSGKGLVRTVGSDGEAHFHRHEVEGEKLADSVAERFRFSRADRRALRILVRNHMRPVQYRSEWGNSAVRRLVRDLNGQTDNFFLLAKADMKAHKPSVVGESLRRLDELHKRVREQNTGRVLSQDIGRSLQAVGFEGSVIGIILRRLEDMVADGVLPENPTVDQCFSALWDSQSEKRAVRKSD